MNKETKPLEEHRKVDGMDDVWYPEDKLKEAGKELIEEVQGQ